ncbi:MAG: prepilin peptidase [Chloroflexi bacterium]|nr:prepilin peptidase [Chloroflexota bacterium]
MPDGAYLVVYAAAGAALGPLLDWLIRTLPRQPAQLGEAGLRARRIVVCVGTPLLFLFAWASYGSGARTPLLALYEALFLVIAAIDLEHRLVLNRVVFPAMAVAPVTALLWGHSPASIALGAAIQFSFFLLNAWVFRGSVAAGDVKLALVLGMVTGYPGAIRALVVTGLVAGPVSAALLLLRLRSRRDFIPFAPFMVLGAFVALLWR